MTTILPFRSLEGRCGWNVAAVSVFQVWNQRRGEAGRGSDGHHKHAKARGKRPQTSERPAILPNSEEAPPPMPTGTGEVIGGFVALDVGTTAAARLRNLSPSERG